MGEDLNISVQIFRCEIPYARIFGHKNLYMYGIIFGCKNWYTYGFLQIFQTQKLVQMPTDFYGFFGRKN